MSVTVWQWAAQSQEEFVVESSGVDPWLSPGRATWICHRERSGVRCRDLPENGRIAWYPSQEVEQDRGHYGDLPGSDGAARNPSQEVEQSRGHYCGLPGSPGLSVEAWLRCLAERVALHLRGAQMLLASLLPLGALGASTAGEGHLL